MIRFITGVARRHPGRMLIALLVAVPILAIVGGGVADRLSVGGFVDPDAESTEVADGLAEEFETGSYGFVLLLEPKDGFVYQDHNVAEGERIVADVEAEPGVLEVASFYNVDRFGTTGAEPASRLLTGKRARSSVSSSTATRTPNERETAERPQRHLCRRHRCLQHRARPVSSRSVVSPPRWPKEDLVSSPSCSPRRSPCSVC